MTVLFRFSPAAALIDFITTSPQVRSTARDYMVLAALAPVCGVMAYSFDGIYIGATWSRDMRNPDNRFSDHLFRKLVVAAVVRQHRTVACTAGVPAGARTAADGALSRAAARDICIACTLDRERSMMRCAIIRGDNSNVIQITTPATRRV